MWSAPSPARGATVLGWGGLTTCHPAARQDRFRYEVVVYVVGWQRSCTQHPCGMLSQDDVQRDSVGGVGGYEGGLDDFEGLVAGAYLDYHRCTHRGGCWEEGQADAEFQGWGEGT